MKVSSGDFPTGIENFEKLISHRKIYIDKTSFLEPLLTSGDDVALLLRPRRFGKTLSMSMIENFLEINYQNPEDRSRQEKLFKNLAVYKNKELCDEFMGRYPVVSISLKSVSGENFTDVMKSMLLLLRDLFEKYSFLLESKKQSVFAKKSFKEALNICSSRSYDLTKAEKMSNVVALAKDSLKFLSNMLFAEYNRGAFIIVDEYDVPLQKATVNNYYDKMLDVVRHMLGNAFKTNNSMEKGFVTGCLRIAHQSIFTDVNNFGEYSLKDMPYSTFIGLTREETEQLLKDCGMENRIEDVRTWYDGYNIAGNDMLCPWSVMKFLHYALAPGNNPATFMPEVYWVNSSGNDIVELCMKYPSSEHSQKLQNLIDGKTEEIRCCEFTTCPDIFRTDRTRTTSFDTFATLMLHTGYLTRAKGVEASVTGHEIVKIPNEEVRSCFKVKAESIYSSDNPEWLENGLSLRDALFAGEPGNAQNIITSMLMTFIGFRDTAYESYYHGFMTGVLSMITAKDIVIKSNQESGNGYSDIILTKKEGKIAVILEFKKSDDDRFITQDKVCNDALEQIEKNQYDFHLKQNGCTEILKYGIAFYGKGCTVKMAEQDQK